MNRLERLALALFVPPGSVYSSFFYHLSKELNPFYDDIEGEWGALRPIHRRFFQRLKRMADSCLLKASEVMTKAREMGCQILLPGDAGWPKSAPNLYSPPLVLFCQGQLDLLSRPVVTMIGTRTPSAAAMLLACDLARILVDQGVVILSGGALGIDSAAHAGALEAGGKTIYLAAGGHDQVYPRENSALFERIAERGLIVSEYPPGCPVRAWHFPIRNRLMAAFGDQLILVQAPIRSGTHSTVVEALALGREIHVCLWSPDCREGLGCLRLAEIGAKQIIDGSELIQGEVVYRDLFSEQAASSSEQILDIIRRGVVSVEVLAQACKLPIEAVMVECMRLELAGEIRRFGSMGYGSILAA